MKIKPLFLSAIFLIASFINESEAAGVKPIKSIKIPSAGEKDVLCTLTTWGRFSFETESKQGVALDLVDRKQGRRRSNGTIGEENGRINEYLDVGEYKIITRASNKGDGDAKLNIFSYKELNANKPQYLIPLKEYKKSLRDHEQISYWIHVKSDKKVFIEALGRNVDDIQLWENGEWVVDIKKSPITSTPSVETPLKGFRIHHMLKAGYYRLTVYGGKEAEWSLKSDKHPAFIKWGVSRASATGFISGVISEKGFNQYKVVSSLSNAVLSIEDKKKRTKLKVSKFPSDPFVTRGNIDSIYEKTSDARCIVSAPSSSYGHLIKVSGTPGEPFVLKTFSRQSNSISVKKTGDYWLSTIHTGYPQDQIGVGGLLTRYYKNDVVIEASQIDTVGKSRYVSRKFNLLNSISLIIWVDASMKYDIAPGGTDMKVKIKRMLYGGNKKLKNLSAIEKKKSLYLEKGFYIVTISPKKKGIATLSIKKSTVVGMLKSVVGLKDKINKPQASVQFPKLSLNRKVSYSFSQNNISPELSGTVLRQLPVDITEALPVYLKSGEKISVPITLKEKCLIRISDIKGKNYSFKINGKNVSTPYNAKPGKHTLTLSSKNDVLVSVEATPAVQLPNSSPSMFPTGEDDPRPTYAKLDSEDTVHLNLDRSSFETYEITVKEPSFYRFETLGRLKTSLTIRDRFVVNLKREKANGVGRNAQILTYLLPGQYLAVVKTEGQSAGRLGLSLVSNETKKAGVLSVERENRKKLPSGSGILYQINVDSTAMYSVVSQGRSGYFNVRLDDKDGWPQVQPGSKGDIKMELAKGQYKLLSLPEDRTTLRIARINLIKEKNEISGKGPHQFEINQQVQNIWMENTADSTKRTPDVYLFEATAPAKMKLSITEGFTATLFQENSKSKLLQWNNTIDTLIPTGKYRIEVMADKKRNHANYSISLKTDFLLPGLVRNLNSYSDKWNFNISVGKRTVVELYSQGMNDLYAELYRENENIPIAVNDDGKNDWNFRIVRLLDPGNYKLLVKKRGSSSGSSSLRMSSLVDSVYKSWDYNKTLALDMKGKMHTVKMVFPENSDILSFTAAALSRVGARIEHLPKDGKPILCAQGEGDSLDLSIAAVGGEDYQVSFWSADHLDENVRVSVNTIQSVLVMELNNKVKANKCLTANGYRKWVKYNLGNDSLRHVKILADNNLLKLNFIGSVNKGFEKSNFIDGGFSPLVSLSKNLWVELVFDNQNGGSISAENVDLKNTVTMMIDNRARPFLIPRISNKLSLVSAEMKKGTPVFGVLGSKGVNFSPGDFSVQPGALSEAGLSTSSSVSSVLITPKSDSVIVLWNAEAAEGSIKEPVTISRVDFDVPESNKISYGTSKITVESQNTVAYKLNSENGAKLSISVPQGCIASFVREDGSSRSFSTSESVDKVVFTEKSGLLYLINPGRSTQFNLTVIELPKDLKNVNSDMAFKKVTYDVHGVNAQFEYLFNNDGVVNVPISLNDKQLDGKIIEYSGDIRSVKLWSGKGRLIKNLLSGDKISLEGNKSSAKGYIEFMHKRGFVKIDILSSECIECLWGDEPSAKQAVKVKNSKAYTLNSSKNWFDLPIEEYTHLNLKSDASCVLSLMKDGKIIKTVNGSSGINTDLALEKGEYSIGVRGISNMNITNQTIEFLFLPMDNLTEKMPPKILLAPGESKMYRFTIDEEKSIGLGIRSDREVVKINLFDSNGKSIGNGQQLFSNLAKGQYYLLLTIPENSDPADCLIRLIGQDSPPDEPPAKIINRLKRL